MEELGQKLAATPVDGHAHWYACFDQRIFLEAALGYFHAAGGGGRLASSSGIAGALLLADPQGCDTLSSWRGSFAATGWKLEETGERESLLARHESGAAIVLVAGRQYVSIEGIEVLSLAGMAEPPGKVPLAHLIEWVAAAGAVPVVPWGFGKWWGVRGRIARKVLERHVERGRPFPLLMGDSAGRPTWSSFPSLLRAGQQYGIGVLAGSDPLPLERHSRRAGRFGFMLPADLDTAAPGAGIRRFLAQEQGCCRSYGWRDSPPEFMSAQLMLRWGRARAKLPGESTGSSPCPPRLNIP